MTFAIFPYARYMRIM